LDVRKTIVVLIRVVVPVKITAINYWQIVFGFCEIFRYREIQEVRGRFYKVLVDALDVVCRWIAAFISSKRANCCFKLFRLFFFAKLGNVLRVTESHFTVVNKRTEVADGNVRKCCVIPFLRLNEHGIYRVFSVAREDDKELPEDDTGAS